MARLSAASKSSAPAPASNPGEYITCAHGHTRALCGKPAVAGRHHVSPPLPDLAGEISGLRSGNRELDLEIGGNRSKYRIDDDGKHCSGKVRCANTRADGDR